MVRVYVPLKRTEYDRLIALAEVERRPIRDQAALLVVRGLPDAAKPPHPAPDEEEARDAQP